MKLISSVIAKAVLGFITAAFAIILCILIVVVYSLLTGNAPVLPFVLEGSVSYENDLPALSFTFNQLGILIICCCSALIFGLQQFLKLRKQNSEI